MAQRKPSRNTRGRKKKQNQTARTALGVIAAILIIALAVVLCTILDDAGDNEDPSLPTSSVESLAPVSSTATQKTSSAAASSKKSGSGGNSSGTASSKPSGTTGWVDNLTPGSTYTDWNLVLVNAQYTLEENGGPTAAELVNIKSGGGNYKLNKKILEPYNAMIAAAKKDGVTLTICSGYRYYSTQKRNFENRVKKYMDQGKSKEEAEAITATIIARPGTSEHQTGLAVDFTPCDESFGNSRGYKWLQQHAAEYGFVQRYKKAKSDITGIIDEPWHFRFVGVEHANYMNEHDLCLEEYIDYLKAK